MRGSEISKHDKRELYKALVKLRGTNLKVQQEIRYAELYQEFIENIIKEVELNNFIKISIVCKAGHHRSVACAEMLIHIYPNRTIQHLTIAN